VQKSVQGTREGTRRGGHRKTDQDQFGRNEDKKTTGGRKIYISERLVSGEVKGSGNLGGKDLFRLLERSLTS